MKIRILTNESAIFRHITPTGNWSEIIQRFMIAVNYYSAIIAHRKHETNYLFCIHPEEGMASQYSATPAIHTGLGLPMYSHISSPIRRVVDFLN
jgi:ribonuclease R